MPSLYHPKIPIENGADQPHGNADFGLTPTIMWTILAMTITIGLGVGMRTIQMTLDDDIVESVDKIVQELGTTRSAFTREALRAAVKRHYVRRLEAKHRRGYELHPVKNEEFSVWEGEQDWGDE